MNLCHFCTKYRRTDKDKPIKHNKLERPTSIRSKSR